MGVNPISLSCGVTPRMRPVDPRNIISETKRDCRPSDVTLDLRAGLSSLLRACGGYAVKTRGVGRNSERLTGLFAPEFLFRPKVSNGAVWGQAQIGPVHWNVFGLRVTGVE